MIKNSVLVSVGGGIGALLRYGLNQWISYAVIPWTTLLINVIGSFVLAFLTFSLFQDVRYSKLKLFVGTGLCGGFTTMSTYALETVKLLNTNPAAALLYTMLTLFIGVGMSFAGMAAASRWSRRREVLK